MGQKKLKGLVIPLILLNLVILSVFSMGAPSISNDSLKTSNAPLNNVVIDGVITADEWEDADWNISFYLDVDNDPDWNGKINVDGNNTLLIGEDQNNLYIALDLCSDRSDNITDEWVGVWLNNAERVFDTYHEWVNFFDNGTESLIHDVDDNQPWEYYMDIVGYQWFEVNDDTEYISHYGTIEGNYENLKYGSPAFNITSETVGSDEVYWLNFSVDMKKWYALQDELDMIQNLNMSIYCDHNVSINEHKIVLWYSDGTIPPLNDPQQVISLNYENKIDYGLGNLTADKKIQFSLIGNNSDPFKTSLWPFQFGVLKNYSNWAGQVQVPFSTIKNYQINWSFGASPNNSTGHRMFEFSIPKTELELYDTDEELGIIVGGYGTLSYVNGSNYWVFSETDTGQYIEQSSFYMYYDMKGLTLPNGVISGYPLFLLIGVSGVISVILIKKKLK